MYELVRILRILPFGWPCCFGVEQPPFACMTHSKGIVLPGVTLGVTRLGFPNMHDGLLGLPELLFCYTVSRSLVPFFLGSSCPSPHSLSLLSRSLNLTFCVPFLRITLACSFPYKDSGLLHGLVRPTILFPSVSVHRSRMGYH